MVENYIDKHGVVKVRKCMEKNQHVDRIFLTEVVVSPAMCLVVAKKYC